MKFSQAFGTFLFIALGVARSLGAPSAEEIIEKVKARSAEAETRKINFAYQRTSRVDYLDDEGKVKKNSVRVYEVGPMNGLPYSKLVQVNGRPATPQQESKRSAARETGDKTRNLALGEELLCRYNYELRGEETVGGRNTWVLGFKPRSGVREDGFIDKLVNAMSGTMWVDQEDYELAKMDIHLGKKISFFGGLAGAIEKLDLQLVQKRVDSTAWLTEGLSLDFTGRKLLTPVRFRCFENCTDFRKVSPLAQNQTP